MSPVRAAVLCAVAAWSCGRSELPRLAAAAADGGSDGGASCLADAGAPRLDQALAYLPSGLRVPATWPAGCVEVEYDPALAAELPDLQRALEAWAGPACTALCFGPPHPFSSSAEGHQLMVMVDHGALRPTDGDVGVNLSLDPIERQLSLAWIFRRPGTAASAGDYLRAVGQALGFEETPGVDSALSGARNSLSAADAQSVCAVYPGCER